MRSRRERPMQFRVATLNLEQNHKRWSDRHPLISAEIAALKPDVVAFNEVSVPLQTAKMLRDAAIAGTGIRYKLVQQTRVSCRLPPRSRLGRGSAASTPPAASARFCRRSPARVLSPPASINP